MDDKWNSVEMTRLFIFRDYHLGHNIMKAVGITAGGGSGQEISV